MNISALVFLLPALAGIGLAVWLVRRNARDLRASRRADAKEK